LVRALAIGAWLVLREWTWLVPRTIRRRVADGFLISLLAAYVLVLVLVPLGAAVVGGLVLRARRRAERRPGASRVLLLSVSCLLGLVLVEGSAAAWLAWAH